MSNATQTPNTQDVMAMLAAMKAQVDKLAAENAALKAAGPKPKVEHAKRTLDEVTKATTALAGFAPKEKTFSTGSTGFYNSFKVHIDGALYQCSLSMVKCGSKPKE